jgi:hypothetical protein
MLCYQHPADAAAAACQRCQRGLCRSCAKQFLPRLCTHCVDEHARNRTREARRTLWLSLPVFAFVGWSVSLSATALPHRLRLYFALLAGMVALGAWIGLQRWRRKPSLAGGTAAMPESETPLRERVLVPMLAGIVFWPWLLFETLRDLQLAHRLRAFVPVESREGTFGFGEASLALASLAAAFTLGTHGLSSYTSVADKLWKTEANLAAKAEQAVRARIDEPRSPKVVPPPAAVAAPAAPMEAPSEPAVAPAPQVEPEPEPQALPEAQQVTPDPQAATAQTAEEEPAHGRRHHRKPEEAAEKQDERAPEVEQAEVEAVPADEPAPPASLDRRYVPGSEMARQALTGNRAPAGTYVTSNGRVVMPAPPPPPK